MLQPLKRLSSLAMLIIANALAPHSSALEISGHFVPAWRAGLADGIPEVEVQGSVKDFGAKADDGRDDTLAFIKAIKKLGGKGAIEIPEGVYQLSAPISLPSNTVLRGQGAGKTHLEINHDGHAFVVQGTGSGSGSIDELKTPYPRVVRGAINGSYKVELENVGTFAVGDGIELVQGYDSALHETDSRWNKSWAKRLIGHFSEIQSIEANMLTLADKVRINMDYSKGIYAIPVRYVSNVGFEDFTIERKDKSDTYTFYLRYSSQVWAKGIHSLYATKGHFYVAMSRRFELRDSTLEFSHDYGPGGHGYGVQLTQRTSSSLIINNVFNRLRHSMLLQVGANGNVLAYNFSNDPYQDDGSDWLPPDISFHGHYAYSNLVEGNLVSEIGIGDYWGPTGPDNLIFRNRVIGDGIRGYDHSKGQIIVANQFIKNDISIDSSLKGKDWIRLNNISESSGRIDKEFVKDGDLPASYYYATKPAFLAGYPWPPIGTDPGENALPALNKFLSRYETKENKAADSNSIKLAEGKTLPPLTCKIIQDSNWKTGNTIRVYLTNTSDSTAITDWHVNILLPGQNQIEKVWNAKWHGKGSSHISSLDWNNTLEPNKTTYFGIKIRKEVASAEPVLPQIQSPMCQASL